MKTDTIFYSLFQAFPSIFFELINRSPDEAANYEFTSREVKQLAFRLDGVFFPTTSDPQKPFYVVEVQFQPNEDLYYRLFAELFLYLRQYKPPHPWHVVVIYPTRSVEIEQALHFGRFFNLDAVTRIYLDELGTSSETSLGVKIVKLVTEPEETAGELARSLVIQARQQLIDEAVRRNFINLIETIIVYKLPQKSREEIAVMLGLSELRNTRFYQEVFEEGREEGREEGKQEVTREAIPRLLSLGLTVEQIVRALDLPLEIVRETAKLEHRKNMSFPEQNVDVFIELLTEQRSRFSPEDLTELAGSIATLPDEIEELSNAISAWSENRPEILEARLKLLEPLVDRSGEKAPGSQEGQVILPTSQPNKQTLLNAIRQR
ncbi:MAG: Rpn family recombination-promoting nuclease/putative transposase [Cyanobacteriota bacterium]|nr:Rpn family recombination-promoting nuclease/putative transposase [Cyanobacteriota bacterium]